MSALLNILSGGAAHGLVTSVASKFKEMTGVEIEGEFGAVGVMADKLRKGMSSDLVILTAPIMAQLVQEHLVLATSITDIGLVETAIAVRAGDAAPPIHDLAGLRNALLAADAIFVPDMVASTAGSHVSNILQKLGIAEEVAGRLKIYPNGATAMRHLAASDATHPIGCTQSTEIISTPGVVLSGSLPAGCELATMYTAGVTTQALEAAAAQALLELLTGADARQMRRRAGFV
ncbi:MAG: molybdate ABC transporter substrate-binding protein [Bradyrhizobium sp.]